jgi:DNA-directed RNA polymerase subunit RPC12/RpoP
MYITQEYAENVYKRPSKTGQVHAYVRKKTVLIFKCDDCGTEFKRDKGSMNPQRINNNYFHVCANCDPKRFAQRKGVEQKRIWNMPAGVDLPISKF